MHCLKRNLIFFYMTKNRLYFIFLYSHHPYSTVRSRGQRYSRIANNDELSSCAYVHADIYRLLLNSWPRAANNDNSNLPRVTKGNKARGNSIYASALGGFFSFFSPFLPLDFIPFSIRLCFIEEHYRHQRGLRSFNRVWANLHMARVKGTYIFVNASAETQVSSA